MDHFNAVVRRVLDFRWRHLSYIEQYVLRPSGSAAARGTGGTPAFAYLNQHINDTEAALISLSERVQLEEFDPAERSSTDEEAGHVPGLTDVNANEMWRVSWNRIKRRREGQDSPA